MFTPTQSSTRSIPLWVFAAIIIGGLFYIGGQYIVSQPQRIKEETEANREITVQGTAEVSARPDIASLTLGVTTGTRATANDAMNLLTQKINAVIQTIRNEGVEDQDIKTENISVHPVYDYTEGRQTLRGFEASESVRVKVRDFNKIGVLLAKTTADGVNQVGGINFEIDQPEALRLEAQEKAIAAARNRAEELSKALGVRLGKVKNFSSSGGEPKYDLVNTRTPYGAGGMEASSMPIDVPSGSQEIQATVNITYSLL